MSAARLSALLVAALLLGGVGGAALWASWLNADSSPSGANDEQDVRISVRRLADGRIEVGLQQRASGDQAGAWSGRRLPDARFLPADAPLGDWRHSSTLTLAPVPNPCAAQPRSLRFAYFAHFAPVSYAAPDPSDPMHIQHRGYEADLISAIEAMNHTNLRFIRTPIDVWPDIWLTPTDKHIDLVGGGITILDERTRNAEGEVVIAFTDGHIRFRHSLLVRQDDLSRLKTHDDLRANDVVGVLRATTGEARLLQLLGAADEHGVLAAGTQIETPDGTTTADGSSAWRITAARVSPQLLERTRLIPPGDRPQVIYLGDDGADLYPALDDGRIDALAGGEVENSDAARSYGGRLAVTALDAEFELGGFSLAAGDASLRACLNVRINWLTNNGALDYADWAADNAVFMSRAQRWNARLGID